MAIALVLMCFGLSGVAFLALCVAGAREGFISRDGRPSWAKGWRSLSPWSLALLSIALVAPGCVAAVLTLSPGSPWAALLAALWVGLVFGFMATAWRWLSKYEVLEERRQHGSQ